MALDPSLDFLSRISAHGADSITGMGGDFRNNLFRMIYNAPPQIRDQMRIISGYRSPERQAQLWDAALRKYGSAEAARKWVAPPGRSRHNLGIAADLGFGNGGLGQAPKEVIDYLHRVAPEYGLEFPLGNEPWHIEPIGSRGGRGGGGAQGRSSTPYGGLIQAAADKYGIDPGMYARLINKESGFNPGAVSPVGAMGLTQMMPATAKAFGVDPTNPASSIEGGAKYLRYLLDRFNNDPRMALAAYNWGEGNVGKIGSYDAVPGSVKGYVDSIMGGRAPVPAVEAGEFHPETLDYLNAPEDVSGAPIPAGEGPKSGTGVLSQAAGGALDLASLIPQVAAPAVAFGENAVRKALAPAPGITPPVDPAYASTLPKAEPAQNLDDAYQKWVEGFPQPQTPIAAIPQEMDPELVGGPAPPTGFSPTEAVVAGGNYLTNLADKVAGGAPRTPAQRLARHGVANAPLGALGLALTGAQTFLEGLAPSDPALMKQVIAEHQGIVDQRQQAEAARDAIYQNAISDQPNFPMEAGKQFDLNFLASIPKAIGGLLSSPAHAGDLFTTPEFVRNLPPDVDKHAWEVLSGWPALVSAGFMIAPWALKTAGKFIPLKVNNLGPEYGPTGLESIVTRRGVLRSAADDVWASVFPVLKKAGADPQLLKEAAQAARVESKSGALHIMNSMLQGIADSLSGVYNVGRQNALTKLKLISNKVPELDRYLKLWHTVDDFAVGGKGGVGLPHVRGSSYQDVVDEINRMHTAMPELKDFRKMYQKNLDEYRGWLASGRFGIYDAATQLKMMTERPNFVPGYGKSMDSHLADEPNSIDALVGDMNSGVRARTDNEARGLVIDAAKTTGKNLFKEVSEAQIARNKQWTDNGSIVTVIENGKKKYYATDPHWAAVLKTDPYYVQAGVAQAAFAYKRLVEELNTGWGNPGFAITNLVRNWQLARLAGSGIGLTRSVLAIPRQLVPLASRNMAQHIDAAMDRGAGGLWRVMPDPVKKNLSNLLANVWHNSHMATMEEHGVHSTAYTSQVAKVNIQQMASMAKRLPPSVQGIWKAINTTLYAIHGAPQAAYAMKELARSKRKNLNWQDETRYIVGRSNALTGDPRLSGQSFFPEGKGRAMPGYTGAGPIQRGAEATARNVSEVMRVTAPWFNVSIQGMKRLGQAYMDNPVGFVSRVWMYQIMPAVSIYLYNKGLNETPEAKANGWDYTDHLIRGRTPWGQMMNFNVGIHGQAPENSIQIPRPHEASIVGRMIEVLLHHGMTTPNSQMFTTSEDLWRAAHQWASNIMMPAPPSWFAAAAMVGGRPPPQNIFGAAPNLPPPGFEPHTGVGGVMQDTLGLPVDSTETNKYLENWIRGLGGAIGHIVGAGYASGWKDTMDTVKESVPIVGNYLSGRTPLLPSTTDITEEYKGKIDFIHKLADNYNNAGKYFLGGTSPDVPLNPSVSAPTNPLYKLFMARVYQDFMLQKPLKNMPLQDIQDFAKLMKVHTKMVKLRESLRGVDSASMSDWLNQIKNNANMQGWIKSVPEDEQVDPRKLFNRVQKNIQMVDGVMLLSIRKVEQQMSEEVGRPITIETLDPFGVVPPKTQ